MGRVFATLIVYHILRHLSRVLENIFLAFWKKLSKNFFVARSNYKAKQKIFKPSQLSGLFLLTFECFCVILPSELGFCPEPLIFKEFTWAFPTLFVLLFNYHSPFVIHVGRCKPLPYKYRRISWFIGKGRPRCLTKDNNLQNKGGSKFFKELPPPYKCFLFFNLLNNPQNPA